MNFKEQYQKKLEQTEHIIREVIPKEDGYAHTVIEAMNYSLLAGGKRLRPMFMLETSRLYGGAGRELNFFMAAIEMIHTYSLVHDDLPAMDNDEYRRGRKTTHIVYGEAMAVLAGDGLLNYAFETALRAFDVCEEPGRIARALQILSKKAGIYGMIGGQCADVEASGQAADGERARQSEPMSLEKLEYIYHLKTGALLEASFMIGAVLAGADEKETARMERVAKDVGFAFQIQDDILDVTSTTQELGKPVHSDEKNEKVTYVSLKGLEQAREDVRTISCRAKDTLKDVNGDCAFLVQLIESLITRQK